MDFLIASQIETIASFFKSEWDSVEQKVIQDFASQKWNILRNISKNPDNWGSFLENVRQNLRYDRDWKNEGLASFAEFLKNEPHAMGELINNSMSAAELESFIRTNRAFVEEMLDTQYGKRWRDEDEGDYINLSYINSNDISKLSAIFKEKFEKYFQRIIRNKYLNLQNEEITKVVLDKGEMHKAIELLGENKQYDTLSKILEKGEFYFLISSPNSVHVPLPNETRTLIESYLAKK
jgi:hypothetical protein